MKTVARVLSVLGILSILAAAAAVVIFFSLDFLVDEIWQILLAVMIGGVVVGVVLFAIAALLSPGSGMVRFPLFRSSRAAKIDDRTTLENND